MISTSMWLKGWLYLCGVIGGIMFAIAITPLGFGSGFPFPILMAVSFSLLYNKRSNYLLEKPIRKSRNVVPDKM
jgi:hypothetical protein